MEIGEPNTDCNGPTRTRFRPKSTGNPIVKMTQHRSKYFLFGMHPSERRLGSGGLRSVVNFDFARVAVPSQRRKLLPNRAPDHSLERPSWHPCQLSDGMDAHLGQARFDGRSYSPHQLDWQIVKKIQLGSGIDDHQAVGFGYLRGNLREMLGAGHANRDRKTNLDSHTAPYRSCNLGRRAEKMGATCNIGEGFVDGDSFDERREIIKHVDGRIAKPLVVLEMTTDEDQLRTKLARPTPRHAAADSKGFSLVGCGQHNSAANSNGFAA